MIRLVGIALVIWGLIVQPLMAGMPVKMANDSTNIEVALDFGAAEDVDKNQSHHEHNIQTTIESSCHDEASSDSFDDCNIDCMSSGMCASSCALSGDVLNLESRFSLDRQNVIPFFVIAERHDSGFPSYIYYPPKFF